MADCLQLKKSNCKNCHKCIRNCPVKSIRFTDSQAHILSNECILCGQCVVVCPQHAKEIVNDTGRVKAMIRSGAPVYVSLAPSFIANYQGAGIDSMRKVLLQLGFAGVEETAVGATLVKREFERLIREEKRDILITSCCHSVNLLIQKHFPSLLPYLADVLSPMLAHAQDIRKRHPDAKVVFIGPCLSKKDEAQMYPGYIDAVLTFEELTSWLAQKDLMPELVADSTEESRTRFFPTPGGVMKTMDEFDEDYTYMAIDGVANCVEVLQDIEAGNVHKCFLEMNACFGACIGGPAIEKERRLPVKDYMYVARYAGKKDFVIDQPDAAAMHKDFSPIEKRLHQPTEAEIRVALRKMGKSSPKDELNCGTCGYNSCREKAIAICQGKAEVSMCLPYLMERAQSFSNHIVSNMPSAVIVVDDDMIIQQVNPAVGELFNLASENEAVGCMITDFLEPDLFLDVMETDKPIRDQHLYLEEQGKYVAVSLVRDSEMERTFAIIADITKRETERIKREEMGRATVATADKVVEKQMRIVQEIAMLLGETTAETKIALTKLKESITDEQ